MSSSGSYQVLGLSSHATGDEIKQAYRAMALRWHPDRHPVDTENATQRFLEIQHAYQTLIRERFPSGQHSSLISQRTESDTTTYQTSQTWPSRSESRTGVSPSTRVSSLGASASAIGSNRSSCESGPRWQGGKGSIVVPHPVPHPPDHQLQCPGPSVSHIWPSHTPYGTNNSKTCSEKWSNHASPSFPNVRMTKSSGDSRPFTIIPPARKQFPPPQATHSQDFYLLHGLHQTASLRSFGIGPLKEWIYGLALSLEDLLNGKLCFFTLSRVLVTGETEMVILEVEVPPGCQEGTRILCRGVGHERKDGTRQDIVLVIEEVNHSRFMRVGNDLVLNVKIPCGDCLRRQNGNFEVEDLDQRKHAFRIVYNQALKGKHVVNGSGMPIRHQGRVVGRGNLIVQYVPQYFIDVEKGLETSRWEIMPQHSKFFNFMRRLMSFRRSAS